jgi:hypothetical protein
VVLIGVVGGLTLATLGLLFAAVRLTLYEIQSESSVAWAVIQRLLQAYWVFVVAVLLTEFWPGIAHWMTGVWNLIL